MRYTRALGCAVAAVFLVYVASANATVIAVLDAGGLGDGTGQTLEDLSTGGDSIGGITGVVTFTAPADYAAETSADVRWKNSEYDYSPGSTQTVAWTFSGLTSGDMWDVFFLVG